MGELKKVSPSPRELLEGFAYCRMLYDDCGNPVDFIYLDTNSTFEQLTGLKKVTGKKAIEATPGIKDLQPELFDALNQVALTGHSERFEIEFKSLGIWLWISVYSTEREHFITTFYNITDRKKIEESLREAYKEIQIQSSLIYVRCNRRKCNGRDRHRFAAPDQAQKLESIKHRMLATLVNEQTLLQLSLCGKSLSSESIYEPRYDETEQITGVVSYTRDVSESKKAEELICQSKGKYLTLFNSTDEDFCIPEIVFDVSGKLIYDCVKQ